MSVEGEESRRSPLLLPVLFAPAFMVILDVFIINVTVPLLRQDLGASESAIQLVVVAYVLTFAISLITAGRLGDLLGRRRMFRLGVTGFTVASLICAAAATPEMLIAGRVLQGLGGAAMLPQMLSIIQVEYPPRERHRAFAYQNIAQAMASVSGQLIGGVLLAIDPFGLGWRVVFLINVPVGLVIRAVSRRIVPESRSPCSQRLDLRGVGLASLALALFLVPAIEGRELGWSLWIFVAIGASVPVALLFVRSQRQLAARGGAPLVEPRLFARRGFRIGVASVVVLFAYFSYFLWFSIFLQEGLGLSALDSGLVYAPMAAVAAAVSFAVPRLPDRYQDNLPPIGAVVAGCGFLMVMAVAGSAESLTPAMVVCTFPLGAGLGLVVPTLTRLILHTVPTEIAGSAAGVVTTAQQIGNAISVALIGTIFFAVLNGGSGPGAYDSAFAVACGTQAAFVFVAAWMLSRVREPIPPAAAAGPEVAAGRAIP
ncbi:MAG TPA: MFS transporter [Solirubrobacterales bacterium]